MKLETIKSAILIFLIMLSLMLTLGIWNYQPTYDEVDSDSSPIEAKLDGNEETKKNIIQPSSIIFHHDNQFKALQSKSEERDLYKTMQEWALYDIEQTEFEDAAINPEQHNVVEVIFPTLLPMEMIQDLFTVDKDARIPSSSFDRMYILLDPDQTSDQIQFLNSNNQFKLIANVQNIDEIRDAITVINESSEFTPYLEYRTVEGKSIYLPNEIEMYERPFQTNSTSTYLLRNVLFNNPSAVRNSRNASGAEIFTDGIRTMIEYKNHIEYTNPIYSDQNMVEGRQLVTETMNHINDHQGWTTGIRDSYQLYDLDIQNSEVEYRLTYDGYPVLENDNYATIDITMRDGMIYQYNRPLVKLKSSFEGRKADLKTGEEVITYLENYRNSSNQSVEDIALGYKMEEQEGYIFNLSPAWFIKSYLGWREIDFELDEGGDQSAMGSN